MTNNIDVKFMSAKDVERMLDELSPEDLEELIKEKFRRLDPEAKKRVLGLTESGLTVITGSFVSLNSDIAVNFQNTSGFDPEALMKALVEYQYRKKENS
jgi:phosphoserine phosphatase